MTQTTHSSELQWMIKTATQTKVYDDCIEKKFTGKVSYRMAMNAIQKNNWNTKSEGGQGKSSYWNCGNTESAKVNYFIHYNCYTGVIEFTMYEAI